MGDPSGFKTAFREEVSKVTGVQRIEYFGSLETTRFRQGESDADIIIYGDVSAADKVRIWELLKELNTEYRLGLETAPFEHPSPFYIDSKPKEVLFRTLFNGHVVREFFRPYTEFTKRLVPTYGEVWRGEKRLDEILGRLSSPLKEAFFYFT